MAQSALVLKRQLANIYTRIDNIDPLLAEFMEKITDEIDSLEREKFSVKEFNEFIDKFNRTLAEGLPALKEEIVLAEANPRKQKLFSESSTGYRRDAVAVLDEKTGLMQIEEKPITQDVRREMTAAECTSFPMKVMGDVFSVGEGITSVVGDVEIPSGTTIDATFVVKGNFNVGRNCKLLKDVKALKDISLGSRTTVEGNLIAGGKITLGPSCVVHGTIDSDGDIEIGENAVVEGIIRSKSSIVLNQCGKVFQTVYAAKGLSVTKATSNV